MKKVYLFVTVISLALTLGLSACNLSLAQDITPPPDFESVVIREPFEPTNVSTAIPEQTQPLSTEVAGSSESEEEPAAGGAVYGSVVNGSGGELPDGLEVTLYGYEQFQAVLELTTEVDEAGQFAFESVDITEDFVFFAVVEYMDMTYFSRFYQVGPEETHVELSVVIYESTNDPSALVVDRLHVFFTYPTPDTVDVIHTLSISNPGNKTVLPISETEPSLRYILPEGATNLRFSDGALGEPFVVTVDGFGDPSPILPGMDDYQMLYVYELPYSRTMTWTQPFTLATNVVVLFFPESGLKITGDQVEAGGTETFNDTLYRAYVGGAMAAGDEIEVEISGRNPSASTGLDLGAGTTSLILGTLGLVLVGIGVWWWFRHGTDSEAGVDAGENPEAIIDEIIALDQKYENGKLDEAVYKRRRDTLKVRLSKMVEK